MKRRGTVAAVKQWAKAKEAEELEVAADLADLEMFEPVWTNPAALPVLSELRAVAVENDIDWKEFLK
jgi:hypothetical protein